MGLEDWRFSGAVFPGDTIHITRKLVEKREHKRPNMGFFIFEVNVFTHKDAEKTRPERKVGDPCPEKRRGIKTPEPFPD